DAKDFIPLTFNEREHGVSFMGRPDARTTRTASATASDISASADGVLVGATENATIMASTLPLAAICVGLKVRCDRRWFKPTTTPRSPSPGLRQKARMAPWEATAL